MAVECCDDIDAMEERIRFLEEENRALEEKCVALEQIQQQMEQLLAEGNHNQVRADLLGMELEQVFSKCAEAMWVVREDGIVLRANQVMLDMLNLTQQEVVGHSCDKLLGDDRCNSPLCPLLTAQRHNEIHEFEIERECSTGGTQHFLVATASLTTLDGSPGIVAQYKDITRHKQAEAELEKANKALEGMAHIDGLTSLANRRAFDAALIREWGRSRRENTPLSLIMCDVDYFKRYNDTYGHQVGDECLRQIAKVLDSTMARSSDFVARYGGEEFVILLPNTPIEGAKLTAEKVRQTVQQLAMAHSGSEEYGVVTLSLGVATQTATGENCGQNLIKTADASLYDAKRSGRNRVMGD